MDSATQYNPTHFVSIIKFSLLILLAQFSFPRVLNNYLTIEASLYCGNNFKRAHASTSSQWKVPSCVPILTADFSNIVLTMSVKSNAHVFLHWRRLDNLLERVLLNSWLKTPIIILNYVLMLYCGQYIPSIYCHWFSPSTDGVKRAVSNNPFELGLDVFRTTSKNVTGRMFAVRK